MTRFEYMQRNGSDGLELDLISEGKFAGFIRYQVYLNFVNDGVKRSEAIKLTSEECNCDLSRVYESVKFFAENR